MASPPGQLVETSTILRPLVESQSISLPGCPDRCGEVKVPYPFVTSEECSLLGKFYLNCTQSSLFLHKTNLQVTNIPLDGDLSVMNFIGRDSVGCDTYAIISGYRDEGEYITGWISSCNFIDSTTSATESCSGVGCWQTPIPSGLKNMTVSLSSYNNHIFVYDFNPCSYAFVVEDGKFNFSKDSFRDLIGTEGLPIVLNWGTGEESCDEAEKSGNLACKGKTQSVWKPAMALVTFANVCLIMKEIHTFQTVAMRL
ncbi:hypothetical protein FEM48_ZijujUnG0031400 [Ziziphus jujuba var. spinosa]|uniref:Wall-associated receptor kinase galacturonan-binding domain-containing protein n=1 Tax=Ziziphus jujuba var. spinosa TaxID=714518 RepID=A0A978U9J5_ZIZJJ|nr:hypothetical protein FEM48_ZijujUnG0031400 [Ziziphus jujuba var. spinosa]